MFELGRSGKRLTSTGNDFSIQLNAQTLCETGACLAKAKVAGVDEALATCRCVASCAFFGSVAYSANARENPIAHFCGGHTAQTVSRSGWVAGVRAPLCAANPLPRVGSCSRGDIF